MNFGTRTSAQILKNFILLHYAEVNIPVEIGAEAYIRRRSPQVGAEVTRAEHRWPHVIVTLKLVMYVGDRF